MTDHIVAYAQVSTEIPSLIGVFLDFENYARNNQGNAYSLSYDEKILHDFAVANGLDLPDLKPVERFEWLQAQRLHDKFEAFQIKSWRERCRKLRQQVDELNPRFQFCVYPAPGTPFIKEAVWREWATEEAPLILADSYTYGRRGLFIPHKEALEANRKALKERMKSVRDSKIPFNYIGGIDPKVLGADPEFSGKNGLMISDIADGYWIFYEGPTYGKPDHEAYWEWFSWANEAISKGYFAAQYEKRETPYEWGADRLDRKTDKLQIGLYGMKPRMHQLIDRAGKFEVHKLRSNKLEYIRDFDAIVLQNLNVSLPAGSSFIKKLRRYVEEGGGLLLAHDTAWYMESPFPKIAVRDRPTHKVEVERHVVETDLKIVHSHESLGTLLPGTRFGTEFRDHMIFKHGRQGIVTIKNVFGDPVYVVGTYGKGRVAFSGCYYGYAQELQGVEREVFFSLLNWLAEN
jgi:hypothetical protein